jgi:hypothetical protein
LGEKTGTALVEQSLELIKKSPAAEGFVSESNQQ